MNIATGRAASKATETYLLTTLQRGQKAEDKFKAEWNFSEKRFLQPVKRTEVNNFATENLKKSPSSADPSKRAQTNAENLRDAFIRMVVVAADNSDLDLHKVMSFSIIKYPLSLAQRWLTSQH